MGGRFFGFPLGADFLSWAGIKCELKKLRKGDGKTDSLPSQLSEHRYASKITSGPYFLILRIVR